MDLEKWALASSDEERGRLVRSLLPGSEERLYYEILHAQNCAQPGFKTSEDAALQMEILESFCSKFGRSTAKALKLKLRHHLLAFPVNPKDSLNYLRYTGLNRVNFSHHSPNETQAKASLPSSIPDDLLDSASIIQRSRLADLKPAANDFLVAEAMQALSAATPDTTSEWDVRRYRQLVSRLSAPDVEGLVRLIVAAMEPDPKNKHDRPQKFGEAPLHTMLTRRQLEELQTVLPRVVDEDLFVQTYLRTLIPCEPELLSSDLGLRSQYLDELWGFAKSLAPRYNDLRLLILHHRIKLARKSAFLAVAECWPPAEKSRAEQEYEEVRSSLFVDYLMLPRQLRRNQGGKSWIRTAFTERARKQAPDDVDPFVRHLGAWSDFVALEAVTPSDDDSMVRYELMEIARALEPPVVGSSEASATIEALRQGLKPYSLYVDDPWLRLVYAEANLTKPGISEEASLLWHELIADADTDHPRDSSFSYSGLRGQGEFQSWLNELQDRVVLSLREDIGLNPTFTPPGARKLVFSVDVKNVPKLTCKLYEINTTNFYRAAGDDGATEIDTSLELDGLEPFAKQVHNFREAEPDWTPLALHRRTFEFPSLSSAERGVFVAEFVGGGVSCRAIVRKGQLRCVSRISAAGHCIRVLDETGRALPANRVSVWLSGTVHRPPSSSSSGEIVVPFTSVRRPQPRTIVLTLDDEDNSTTELSDWSFSSLDVIEHLQESYTLKCGFFVDREALIQGNRNAQLIVRPEIRLNGELVSSKILEEAVLKLNTTVIEDGTGQHASASHEVRGAALDSFLASGNSASTDFVHSFAVPDRLRTLHIKLEAKVRTLGSGNKVAISAEKTVNVSQMDDGATIKCAHLRRNEEGAFVIAVLGKSGEPSCGVPIELRFQHRFTSDILTSKLCTSEKTGEVFLGFIDTENVSSLTATLPRGVGLDHSNTVVSQFKLGYERISAHSTSTLPKRIVCHAGAAAQVFLPYFQVAQEHEEPQVNEAEHNDSASGGKKKGRKARLIKTFFGKKSRKTTTMEKTSKSKAAPPKTAGLLVPRREEFSLLEHNWQNGTGFRQCHFDKISLVRSDDSEERSCSGVYVRVAGLPEGRFTLCLKRTGYSVEIVAAKGASPNVASLDDGWIHTPLRSLMWRAVGAGGEDSNISQTLGAPRPLQISFVCLSENTGDEEGSADQGQCLLVGLAGDPSIMRHVRVHILATHFTPLADEFVLSKQLSGVVSDRRELGTSDLKQCTSQYVSGRKLGDELEYVMARKAMKERVAGNMLPSPQLLLSPWAVRSTETTQEVLAAGNSYASAPPPPSAAYKAASSATFSYGQRRARRDDISSGCVNARTFATVDFLPAPSVLCTNLQPNTVTPGEEGSSRVVSIPLKELMKDGWQGLQSFEIVAADLVSVVTRRWNLPKVGVKGQDRSGGDKDVGTNTYRDTRLLRNFDSTKHYTESQNSEVVDTGETFALDNMAGAKMRTYDTVQQCFSLLSTLANTNHSIDSAELERFNFLGRWDRLEEQAKRDKLGEFGGHELHLFLFFKDPEFFKRVVKPHIKNKMDKQFLDHYLLGNFELILRRYAGVANREGFARLNAAEKALLAEVLAAARSENDQQRGTALAAEVLHAADSIPNATKASRFAALFRTALQRQGDGGDAELAEAFEEARIEAESAQVKRAAARAEGTRAKMKMKRGKRKEKPAASVMRMAVSEEEEACEAFCGFGEEDLDEEIVCPMDEDFAIRAEQQQQQSSFRSTPKTMLWAESHYWKVQGLAPPSLVPPSGFWSDFARHSARGGGGGNFMSRHFGDATHTLTELLLAIAVLGVPFRPQKHAHSFAGGGMAMTPGSPLVVFSKQILPCEAPTDEVSPILLGSSYFDPADRWVTEHGEQREKFVDSCEVLVGKVYGCKLVVTNVSSSRKKLRVLMQIPRGAVPASGAVETDGRDVTLSEFSTTTLTYCFYFPRPGDFEHFPVHVAMEGHGLVAAFAEPARLRVVAERTRIDTRSWKALAAHGADDEVLAFLRDESLELVDLSLACWRMREKQFFERATALLAARFTYHREIWLYSLLHHDEPRIAETLQAEQGALRVGPHFRSTLLCVDPVRSGNYEFVEFRPLVTPRAHPLGSGRARILNTSLKAAYEELLGVLSHMRPDQGVAAGDAEATALRLAVVYFHLCQNRVEEAAALFERLPPPAAPAADDDAPMRPVTTTTTVGTCPSDSQSPDQRNSARASS